MDYRELRMERTNSKRRRRGPLWCLGLLLLAGCNSVPHAAMVQHSRYEESARAQVSSACPEVARAVQAGKPIPICFDTVFRLAQDQNGQIRLARMRLEDAETDQVWASKHWMPDLSIGMGAWRHDGGIQDFYGNLIKSDYTSALAGVEITGKYDWKEILLRRVEAERRVWQQRADVSKLSSENLLDATTAYVDLLSARTGVVVSIDTEIRLRDLLEQTRALAKVDEGLRVEVVRIETELMAQTVLTVKLREASKGSAAKLAYLLGLDPCCEFVVADKALVPIAIIDAKQPVQQLVEQALTKGPGVRELEGLLRVVEELRNSNYGLTHWMPSIEVSAVEGGYGAGPNTSLDWTNRFDLGLKLKWSLNEFAASKQKRQQAERNIEQVHLSYQDLRSKLTLGVQEARDAIQSGQEQIGLAEKHIRYAEESHRLSDTRLKQNIKGRSSSEVLLALRALGGAKLEYLQAVRDFDKAQLRLFVLVGATEVDCKK
jgi:outer membrane protein TolC